MVVSTPADLAKIKTEWEAVFGELPPEDGDVNLLPEEKKLVWVELPQCQQRRAPNSFASSSASSAGL
eukprot:58345-Pleurochrysis_carterae.AAC.1